MNIDDKIKINLITDRMDSIKEMVSGQMIDSIIDFNNNIFENPIECDDIRELIPKKYIEFTDAIRELGGKLLYIKSGSTGHTFRGIHLPPNDNKPSYAVKIVAYSKKENYGDMYSAKRPENAELLMIKLLSFFVINKQTPHIVLPITTFNTGVAPLLNLTSKDIGKNNKKFMAFIENYKKGEYYDNISVLISEWANGGDLLDYIKKNYASLKITHWRVIFFQIISVLAVIQQKYPSFRHNDMKANNILVNIVETVDKKYCYKLNGQLYIVPNIGFQIKLWDFDFACIPGVVDNAKVYADWTNKINVNPEQNRYYDIHYFFNTLIRKGFFPEFLTAPEIPKEVKDFVLRIVPEKYRESDFISERGRLLVKDELFIPDDIIKTDPFFKRMRKY